VEKKMKMSGFALGLLVLLAGQSASAHVNYPERPIHVVIGFPPGSPPDIFARLLGQKLSESWGKPVLIENVTGAAGNIAANRVAKAEPDGYTVGVFTEAQIVVNSNLYTLPYNPVTDFAPVSELYAYPDVLVVNNSVPAKSVEELVALAKARPGGLTFASGGSGSAAHMAAELFKSAAGIDIRHIPYKGVMSAMPDLLGGRVSMVMSPISIVLPMVRQGKLRALAVTSLKRSSAAPQLPTVAEAGYPSFEVIGWNGLFAPANTPEAIIRALHDEAAKALALPELQAKLADLGLESIGNSPAEFSAIIKSETPKWANVIKNAGIKRQ
jgi:tripartite-type tricarboxylate transporter receptor subunit TctC